MKTQTNLGNPSFYALPYFPLDKSKYTEETNIKNISHRLTNSSSETEELINYLYDIYAKDNVVLEDMTRTVPEIKSLIRDTVKANDNHETRIQESFVEEIYNKHYGYWFLQKYLDNENVYDIIIFDWDRVRLTTIENGVKEHSLLPPTEHFPSKKAYKVFVNRLTKRLGVVLNNSNKDVKIDDREHKVRLSINTNGNSVKNTPVMALRSHSALLTKEDILEAGMLEEETFEFLKEELLNKKTMIIAGAIGSGKTTLCRSLLYDMDDIKTPILVIEPFKELYLEELGYKSVYEFDSQGTKTKGSTLAQLNVSSQTYIHDIFFFAEIREDADVKPFIVKSMTGIGGLTTMHAETAEECYENLILKADTEEGVKSKSVQKSVEKAVNYYVMLEEFKLKSIIEVMPNGDFKEIYCRSSRQLLKSL